MRLRWSKSNVVLIIFVGTALVAILFGLDLLPFGASRASQPLASVPTTPANNEASNVIVGENARIGTNSWQIPAGRGATTQIQGYASATSVLPGQTLTFYVSTQQEGTTYSIAIYRLGWYGGHGGRLMAPPVYQTGHAQGYYNQSTHLLVDCNSCRVDTQTGLVETNWQPSYRLTVASDWTTGVYLAKFTTVTGELQTYVPFDVRGNAHSVYAVVTSDTTYAAYNEWGGYSLYQAYTTFGIGSSGRGVKVSFDRPYADNHGSGLVLYYEVDAIRWFERQGYDLSYMSSVDLHEDSKQLLQHRAYLSIGHDEYWSKEMRDGVENARNQGISLAFLGGNDVYWQIRFEPDSAGTPDRTIVCYKVSTGDLSLALDPFYGRDNTRVTALWRDPVVARPENALIGIMYSSLTHKQRGFPWQVSPLAKSTLLDGTGLQPGQPYGCGLVGNEWDRVFPNGATPAGLQVLGASPTVDEFNKNDVSNTTYYITPSGAMVFAAGSIYWTAALDSYRFYTDDMCTGRNPVVPGMQNLLAHVMEALVVHNSPGQLIFTSTTYGG
jgi:N,N-dimethylformamidase beta subunit-like protein